MEKLVKVPKDRLDEKKYENPAVVAIVLWYFWIDDRHVLEKNLSLEAFSCPLIYFYLKSQWSISNLNC